MTLLKAIAQIEGYYAKAFPKNRPQRNCNPGNINYAPWLAKYGAVLETIPEGIHETPRFASFPDEEHGFAALHDLLSGPSYVNLPIEDAINRYAPPVENATVGYVSFVCRECGCQPTDIVGTVLGL